MVQCVEVVVHVVLCVEMAVHVVNDLFINGTKIDH